VARLGRSSVTYEVGVFKSLKEDSTPDASWSEDIPAAVGGYTHVFVDKDSRMSVVMNARTRVGLEKLVIPGVTRPSLSSGAKL
jgi:acyl-CoA thioester hydrolase